MLKWIKRFKEREKLKLTEAQRQLAVEEIRETEGFRVIMEELEYLSDEVRDVSVLAANYGNKRIDEQLGVLGGAGLIASHVINNFIEKYEKESIVSTVRDKDRKE